MRAAEAAGFELPAAILDVVGVAAHCAQERASCAPPKPHVVGDVKAILAGASVLSIIDADAAHAAAVARWERANELLQHGARLLEGMAGQAFVGCGDDLIRNELRQAVADVLDRVREVTKHLRKFAPDFNEAALLAKGTTTELDCWRSSRELQATFDTLVMAWLTTWRASTGRGRELGPEFCPTRAGAWYAWVTPDDVQDERLRLGHDVEVLRVASASSPYRLIAPSELAPLLEVIDAALPKDAPRNARVLVRRDMVASGA
jgi:hypothetical protein